jgi:acyl carrier protein
VIKDDVVVHVKEVMAKILCMEPVEIDEATSLSEYGLTSVDLIDAVVTLEARYDIQFDPSLMDKLSCRSLAENIKLSLAIR